MDKAQLTIDRKIRDEISKHRIYKRETYNEILERMLEVFVKYNNNKHVPTDPFKSG